MTEFQDQKTKINKAIEFANELIEKAKIAVESDDEQNNDYLLQTNKYCQQLLNLGVNDISNEKIDKKKLEQSVQSLNYEKKEIFNLVIDEINTQ